MQISATVHVNGLFVEQAGPTRFAREAAVLERLTEEQVEALRAVIDAGSTGAMVHKLQRLMAASLQPEIILAQMLEQEPGAVVTFCFELVSYRSFMDKLLAGEASARVIADSITREQRAWLSGLLARFRRPSQLLPDTEEDAP
jgi:hypothetical protein